VFEEPAWDVSAILAYIASKATRAVQGSRSVASAQLTSLDRSVPMRPKPEVLQPYCNRVRLGWYVAGNRFDVIVGFLLIYAIFLDTIERDRI
jgi:hypothetical protein